MGALLAVRCRILATSLFIVGLVLVLGLLLFASPSKALSPASVVVVANPDLAGSVEVAEHYMEAREIPEGNLLSVAGPTSEIISRAQYNAYEADVEEALEEANLTDRVEVLVLVYGVPLKVNSDDTWNYNGNQSSVDGELALLVSDNMQSGNDGRYSNPYFNAQEEFQRGENNDMLLVARLDGHNPAEAKALVDEALSAEANNTQGWAYFDRDTGMSGNYAFYDAMIVEAFNRSLERGLDSALEESAKDLGQEGAVWSSRSTPGAKPANGTVDPFFYWGWYANASYFDSYDWTQGAVGMRLHSFNARSMRDSTWVTGAVADKIAGSTGHVWEPWLDAAAYPHLVMDAIYNGYTAAEAFWMGTPYLSWQNIVVGDPLYTPVGLNFTLELVSDPPAEPLLPGENLTLDLTLTNHHTIHQEFDLTVEGLPWGLNATVSPTRVWVNGSGGVAQVKVTVELDPDPTLVEASQYILNVSAEPTNGPEDRSTVQVNLTVAQVAGLRLVPLFNNSAAPGENSTLALGLYNMGNHDDNFTLGFSLPERLENGSAQWLEEGWQEHKEGVFYLGVVLEFRDQTTLLFNITLPFDMSLWAGTLFNISIAGSSTHDPEVTSRTNVTLEVDPYYGLQLDPPADMQNILAGSQAPVNFTLNNTGNAPFEITVTAYSEGENEWLEGSSYKTLELSPQESRIVNLTLEVKPEALAGPQILSWDLTWQGPTAAGEVTLIVQRVDVWLEQVKLLNQGYSNDPREDDPMTLKGIVRSNGLPIQGGLELNIEGIDWRTVTIELEPDELPYQFSHNFTLNTGEFNLSLSIVVPEGIFELSETNNLAWVEVEVFPVPDLRIASFTVTPGVPDPGQTQVNVTFTTVPSSWSGDDTGDGFLLKPSGKALVSLDGEVIQQYWVQQPDQKHTLNLTIGEGEHNMTVTLDPDGLWPETDDDNNVAWVEFTVEGADDEGTSSNLPLLIGAIMAIAIPATVVLVMRKRKGSEQDPE